MKKVSQKKKVCITKNAYPRLVTPIATHSSLNLSPGEPDFDCSQFKIIKGDAYVIHHSVQPCSYSDRLTEQFSLVDKQANLL